MGLAPDSSVPLATAGVQWLCKGPWVQNGLFGYRRCSPGTGSLAAHRSSIIQPDHKGRSRGASPFFKVFILVCRELVLDSIAPNITNKQQSKWFPSQPLVGILFSSQEKAFYSQPSIYYVIWTAYYFEKLLAKLSIFVIFFICIL